MTLKTELLPATPPSKDPQQGMTTRSSTMRSRLPTAVNRIATRAMTRSTAIATRSSSIGHGRATPGSTIGRKRPRRLRRRFRTHNRLAGRAHENGTNGCCGESANTNVESQENGMTAVGSEEYIAQTGIENDTIKNTEGDAQHDLHDDGLVLDSSDSVGDDQFDDETDETDEDEMDALLEKQEEVIMKLEESMVDCVFDIHGENSEDKMRQQSMSGQHFASSAGVELVCTEETEETIRSDNANICSSGSICTIKDGSVRDASESAKAQQDAHWNIIRERARSLSIDIDRFDVDDVMAFVQDDQLDLSAIVENPGLPPSILSQIRSRSTSLEASQEVPGALTNGSCEGVGIDRAPETLPVEESQSHEQERSESVQQRGRGFSFEFFSFGISVEDPFPGGTGKEASQEQNDGGLGKGASLLQSERKLQLGESDEIEFSADTTASTTFSTSDVEGVDSQRSRGNSLSLDAMATNIDQHRTRGDSIIFDPTSFKDGGIHEQNALRKRRDDIALENIRDPASDAELQLMNVRGRDKLEQISTVGCSEPTKLKSCRSADGTRLADTLVKKIPREEGSQTRSPRSVSLESSPKKEILHRLPASQSSIPESRHIRLGKKPGAPTKESLASNASERRAAARKYVTPPPMPCSPAGNAKSSFFPTVLQSSSCIGTPASAAASAGLPSCFNGSISLNMDLLNKGGRIGIYLPEERRLRIARFHSKRLMRIWRKRIKYDCRKKLADGRPRIKGRFVRRCDVEDEE